MKLHEFETQYSISPSEYLKSVLKERKISQKKFAEMLPTSNMKYVKKLLNGEIEISINLAIRLEDTLGISRNIWMNLQSNYNKNKKA